MYRQYNIYIIYRVLSSNCQKPSVYQGISDISLYLFCQAKHRSVFISACYVVSIYIFCIFVDQWGQNGSHEPFDKVLSVLQPSPLIYQRTRIKGRKNGKSKMDAHQWLQQLHGEQFRKGEAVATQVKRQASHDTERKDCRTLYQQAGSCVCQFD